MSEWQYRRAEKNEDDVDPPWPGVFYVVEVSMGLIVSWVDDEEIAKSVVRDLQDHDRETEQALLRRVRDWLEENKQQMREYGGNFFYGWDEDILEVFAKGGEFEIKEEEE